MVDFFEEITQRGDYILRSGVFDIYRGHRLLDKPKHNQRISKRMVNSS